MKCKQCGKFNRRVNKNFKCRICGSCLLPEGDDTKFKIFSFKEDPEIIELMKTIQLSDKKKTTRSKLIRAAIRMLLLHQGVKYE